MDNCQHHHIGARHDSISHKTFVCCADCGKILEDLKADGYCVDCEKEFYPFKSIEEAAEKRGRREGAFATLTHIIEAFEKSGIFDEGQLKILRQKAEELKK